jgi:hypothetical protein
VLYVIIKSLELRGRGAGRNGASLRPSAIGEADAPLAPSGH